MPESSPSPRGHRDPEDSSGSCSDSSSGSDADGEDESSSITQEKHNTAERSGEFLCSGSVWREGGLGTSLSPAGQAC